LRDERPGAKLVLGGDGEVAQAIELIGRLGMQDCVEAPGWMPEGAKKSILEQTPVFALPSYHEGLPMSILEAMAYGIPVVATNVGAISDAITDGKEGFIVTPGNIEQLALRLGDLLSDSDLRRRMGDAGATKVRARFTAQIVAQKMEALYTSVIGGGQGGDR
jgi:glycosyltransferase involved in cell wall biosynthesis